MKSISNFKSYEIKSKGLIYGGNAGDDPGGGDDKPKDPKPIKPPPSIPKPIVILQPSDD